MLDLRKKKEGCIAKECKVRSAGDENKSFKSINFYCPLGFFLEISFLRTLVLQLFILIDVSQIIQILITFSRVLGYHIKILIK